MTDFETHPDRYVHWKLSVDGALARLVMQVDENKPHREGYKLKLNSYDLGVDIELADAVQRLRFEHPSVKVVVVSSGNQRAFCAGANITMLATSTHPFKVNFCKYTNETRCSIEDASRSSGLRWLAAVNGPCAGGGYELAIACDEIFLVDDGNSSVSLPEVPLLGVLPGTGGLTRLVDKRKVRRDLADVFSTLAEGAKAKKAVEWRLVDAAHPRSKFDAAVADRAAALTKEPSGKSGEGIKLSPIAPQIDGGKYTYRHVTLTTDPARRVAELTVRGPAEPPPASAAAVHQAGADLWALRAMRELDDAILRLRFDHEEIGLVLLRTEGDVDRARAWGDFLVAQRADWLVNEIVLFMARTLRRLDATAKSLFAVAEPGSAFAGPLLEIALAADRIYALDDSKRPVTFAIDASNGGTLPMANGLTRLQSRFLGTPGHADQLVKDRPKVDAAGAMALGLVTAAPDEIDWDDEIRVAVEERVSLSPDALTGMEASLRFGGPETMDTKIYGRLSAWQNWIFTRPNATGEHGALKLYGQPERPKFDWEEDLNMSIDLTAKIPNNVDLANDPKLQRALEHWQPKYLEWWMDMGPSDFAKFDIYLRTAIGVGKGGWANFGHVKMPDYRWGIFLAEPEADRKIHFGDPLGTPAWQVVPGELRNRLRRLVVTQADTEPASVEQQRLLGHTAPSLVDLRNLFQVNVEEGRHLWAMVYLLHKYFGSDGRDEAEDSLRRRSGNPDNPRILQAFNKPVREWLTFFCFTAFTDRDGKYQLAALAESGFDPLARTTQFMLTEEAHHLSVGENGVGRVVQRTAELMKEGTDPRKVGAIPLDIIQKYVTEWSTASYDLFGGEDSSNAAESFACGLKGRYREGDGIYKDPKALDQIYTLEVEEGGKLVKQEIPLRRAMNALLLDSYFADATRIVDRWNRTLAKIGLTEKIALPSLRFNRNIGVHGGKTYDPAGQPITAEESAKKMASWYPSDEDRAYVESCMVPVLERGKFANWIAPPATGINEQPVDFEYVKVH